MNKHLTIKVCGMKNRSNILDIQNVYPNYIGFIFYNDSIRFVGDNFIVPNIKTCKKVGVFVNDIENNVINKSFLNKLDYVQLHGNESPNYCLNIMNKGIKIIKAFGINEKFDFNKIKSFEETCSYFLFDNKTYNYGGSGKKFNWKKINEYNIKTPFFISGGISIDDIEAILSFSHPQFFGIDINSHFEINPGIKDVNKVNKFIKKIRL